MPMSFNKLTAAQAERLAMLIEECAEVVEAGTKILRHGYDSYHPSQKTPGNNYTNLCNEVEEVIAIAHWMNQLGDIGTTTNPTALEKIIDNKKRWTHHQI